MVDSSLAQYIWTGSLAPSADTIISLPAISSLTNLSLNSASGNHGFVALVKQVNGQMDEDQSNDTITSQFTVAPKWPYTFLIKMKTSSIGADGNLSSNPADASWQISDAHNNIIASRTNTNVVTTYYDTVTLNASNFYVLTVSTSQCYGLNWWALAGLQGYTAGSLAVVNYNSNNVLLNLNGTSNVGSYRDDFGCGFVQYFTTQGQCQAFTPTIARSGNNLNASSGSSYQWYKNGNLIFGATGQTYALGVVDGNYTVEVTDESGCTGTSASFPFFNTGISDLSEFALGVSLFPNPAREVFNINVNAELIGTQYCLYDITGREILNGKIESESTSVFVRDIASGIYLVSISNGANNITKRIAIQK